MIFALGFLVVLLVIAAGVHGTVLHQLQESGRLRRRVAAEDLADGAVARATAWFVGTGYQRPDAGALTVGVPVLLTAGKQPLVLPSNHPDGYTDALGRKRSAVVSDFNAYLTGQKGAAGTFDVTASLMVADPETWEIVAVARVGDVERRVGALLVRQGQALFEDAIFGAAGVDLQGNPSTDSYDSTLGAYGGSNRTAGGNVRSNGDIKLQGSAQVNGDARPGPDGTVVLKGNPTVTGAKDPASGAKDLAAATVPAGAISLGAIKVENNDRRTIKSGTYTATSLVVGGSGILTIDSSSGPVTLYVTGEVKVEGNGSVIVTNNGPRAFFIVQVGGAEVSVHGQRHAHGRHLCAGFESQGRGRGRPLRCLRRRVRRASRAAASCTSTSH